MPQLDQNSIYYNVIIFSTLYIVSYIIFYTRIFKAWVFSQYIKRRWKKMILWRLIYCKYSLSLATVYKNGNYLNIRPPAKKPSCLLLLLDPLEQFETACSGCAYSSKLMVFSMFVFISLLAVGSFKYCEVSGMRGRKSFFKRPNNIQALEHYAFLLFVKVYKENVSHPYAMRYVPVFLFNFMFILFSNIMGLFPYSFTLTGSIVITFLISSQFFIGSVIISYSLHRSRMFQTFLPDGVPLEISPFLVIVELISYVARVFSLAIRLFANLMAGHSLMKILIGFVWTMFLSGGGNTVLFIFPLTIVFLVTCLEVAIAVLQAYVFTILSLIYLNDAIVIH